MSFRVQTELRRVLTARNIPRHFKRVLIKRSQSEPLIQIADLVAGAILRRDAKGDARAYDYYDYVEGELRQVLEFRG